MEIVEFYNSDRQYMKPDGTLYTKESIVKDFPAINLPDVVILIEGNSRVPLQTFPIGFLLSKYGLSESLNKEEMLAQITEAINNEKTESDSLSRIAASLEYLTLLLMPDLEENDEF